MTHPQTQTQPDIKAVLFDYGMVLSGPAHPPVWAHMLTLTGLSPEEFEAAYWAPRRDYDRGALSGRAYWHTVSPHSSPETIDLLIQADTDLWTQPNPPMLDWARQLQHAGIRTGILSNMPDAMAEGLVARFDWIGNFDHCTWSHALNLAKPEIAIYRHAAEGLTTDPAKILFVDDRADNIAAARAFGMQAIQYTNHQQFLDEMKERGFSYLIKQAVEITQK